MLSDKDIAAMAEKAFSNWNPTDLRFYKLGAKHMRERYDAREKVLVEAIQIAIHDIGDGDNGPPPFYSNTFNTLEYALAKLKENEE